MSKKVKEPFFVARVVSVAIGLVILALILLVLYKGENTDLYKMVIFGMAAVLNFISATIGFSEGKRMRGNLCAILCAIFLLVTVTMAVRMFIFV